MILRCRPAEYPPYQAGQGLAVYGLALSFLSAIVVLILLGGPIMAALSTIGEAIGVRP